MAFHETQFPTDISRGAVGGPMFSTVVVVTGSGAEQRVAQWQQGRMKWDVSHALKTPAQASALLAFFLARAGKLHGFRFKDWLDYTTGSTKYNCATLTSTTFQLQKTYSSGGITYTRTIKKPVSGTVHIYNGDTEITTGWTVDTTTGVVTFGSAPGYTPSATFEWDVPVRFDTDEMRMSLDDAAVRSWQGVPIVEILV